MLCGDQMKMSLTSLENCMRVLWLERHFYEVREGENNEVDKLF